MLTSTTRLWIPSLTSASSTSTSTNSSSSATRFHRSSQKSSPGVKASTRHWPKRRRSQQQSARSTSTSRFSNELNRQQRRRARNRRLRCRAGGVGAASPPPPRLHLRLSRHPDPVRANDLLQLLLVEPAQAGQLSVRLVRQLRDAPEQREPQNRSS